MSLSELLLSSSKEGVADLLRFDFDGMASPETTVESRKVDFEIKSTSEESYSSDASMETLPGKSTALTSSVNVEVIEKLYRSLSQPLEPVRNSSLPEPQSPLSPYESDRQQYLDVTQQEDQIKTPSAHQERISIGSPRSPTGSPTCEQREVMVLRGAAETAIRTEDFLREELLVAQEIANSYKAKSVVLETSNKDLTQQLLDTLELHTEKEKEYLAKYLQQEREVEQSKENTTFAEAQTKNHAEKILSLQLQLQELNKAALSSDLIVQKEEEIVVREHALYEKINQYETTLRSASEDAAESSALRQQNNIQNQLIDQLESELSLRSSELVPIGHLKTKILHHETTNRELQREKVLHEEEKLRLREIHSEQLNCLELKNLESTARAASLDTILKNETGKQSELTKLLQNAILERDKALEESRYLEQVYARVKANNDGVQSTKIHAAALTEVEVHALRDQLHELVNTSSALRERLVTKEEETTSLRRDISLLQAKVYEVQRTPVKHRASLNLSPLQSASVHVTSTGRNRSVSPRRIIDFPVAPVVSKEVQSLYTSTPLSDTAPENKNLLQPTASGVPNNDFQSPYAATPRREDLGVAADMQSCEPIDADRSVPPVPFRGINCEVSASIPRELLPQYDQLFRSRGISPPRMSLQEAKNMIRSYPNPPAVESTSMGDVDPVTVAKAMMTVS